jgi:phosphohistidine phosphatase
VIGINMNVYLLRHGVAAERDPLKFPNDDERPLTDAGIEKMREAAAGVAQLIDAPDVMLTSPLVRTRQTADIIAKAFGGSKRLETSHALRPGATPAAVRELLKAKAAGGAKSVMVVGHEPDMGEIASALIGARGSVVEFKKGSLCAIQLADDHSNPPGVLLWHLAPKQLRAIGRSA